MVRAGPSSATLAGMTDDLWPDPVPGAPYTVRSLALLALGDAARRTSDFARSLVPTGPGHRALDGVVISDAIQLQALVEHVVIAAVVAEREDGTDWAEIADALGVTPAAAEETWTPIVAGWHDDVEQATEPGHHHDLPDVLTHPPDGTAGQLDDWVVRHREPIDPVDGEHPVTDTLRLMHPMLELLHLQHRKQRLRDRYGDPPPTLLVPILEREADVHAALAADARTTTSGHAQDAERARIQATALRGRIDPPSYGPNHAE